MIAFLTHGPLSFMSSLCKDLPTASGLKLRVAPEVGQGVEPLLVPLKLDGPEKKVRAPCHHFCLAKISWFGDVQWKSACT